MPAGNRRDLKFLKRKSTSIDLTIIPVVLGGEIELKSLRLLLDYQLARISDPNVSPNFWRHDLLFGLRF